MIRSSDTHLKNRTPKEVSALFDYLTQVFGYRHITYWIDAGTLLRIIRDHHLLSSDLDLGAWQSEVENILNICDDLKRDGFLVQYQGGLPFLEDHIKIIIPERFNVHYLHIDIHLYREMGQEAIRRNIQRPVKIAGVNILYFYKMMSLSSVSNTDLKGKLYNRIPFNLRSFIAQAILRLYILTCESVWQVVPLEYFKNLDILEYNGILLPIPKESASYLEYRYGPEWTKAKKSWRVCDGNLIRFRNLRRFPENKNLNRRLISDQFSDDILSRYNDYKVGKFKFTPQELTKIRSMD